MLIQIYAVMYMTSLDLNESADQAQRRRRYVEEMPLTDFSKGGQYQA